jgi:hypothetical protein
MKKSLRLRNHENVGMGFLFRNSKQEIQTLVLIHINHLVFFNAESRRAQRIAEQDPSAFLCGLCVSAIKTITIKNTILPFGNGTSSLLKRFCSATRFTPLTG